MVLQGTEMKELTDSIDISRYVETHPTLDTLRDAALLFGKATTLDGDIQLYADDLSSERGILWYFRKPTKLYEELQVILPIINTNSKHMFVMELPLSKSTVESIFKENGIEVSSSFTYNRKFVVLN